MTVTTGDDIGPNGVSETSIWQTITLLTFLFGSFLGICAAFVLSGYTNRKIKQFSDRRTAEEEAEEETFDNYLMIDEPFDEIVDTTESVEYSDNHMISPYVVSKE